MTKNPIIVMANNEQHILAMVFEDQYSRSPYYAIDGGCHRPARNAMMAKGNLITFEYRGIPDGPDDEDVFGFMTYED